MIIIENLLYLLKLDLGITHTLRDEYFHTLLKSSKQELEVYGITLNMNDANDQLLIVDFAAWTYRKRQEDIPLSNHIKFRINQRVIKKAGSNA